MTIGPQYEYMETDYNVGVHLQNPDSEVRREVDRILAGENPIDGGTP